MKTNTFFYTLLIALFSLTFVSCDKNDELTNIDEMSKLDNDSISEIDIYRSEIDDETIPDSTGLKIFNEKYDFDSIGNEVIKIQYRSETDDEVIPDTTGLS
jgi:hypothetical protein